MKKIKPLTAVKFAIFILIIGSALFVLFKNREFLMNLRVDEVMNFAESANTKFYAIIITLIIFIIKPFFVIIPSSIIAIANGLIFGPIEGFLITMVGNFISSTLAFFLARGLGKEFVQGIIGKKLDKIQTNFEKNDFLIMAGLRLVPIVPLDPLSYAFGLSKVSYRKFILATIVGVAPETLCYSVLGKNFDKPFSPQFIIPVAFLIIGLLCSRFIIKKVQK